MAPTSLLDGEWEVHIPLTAQTVTLELENVMEMVPSWRQKLGLTGFAEEKRGSVIKITTPVEAATFVSPIHESFKGTALTKMEHSSTARLMDSTLLKKTVEQPRMLFIAEQVL